MTFLSYPSADYWKHPKIDQLPVPVPTSQWGVFFNDFGFFPNILDGKIYAYGVAGGGSPGIITEDLTAVARLHLIGGGSTQGNTFVFDQYTLLGIQNTADDFSSFFLCPSRSPETVNGTSGDGRYGVFGFLEGLGGNPPDNCLSFSYATRMRLTAASAGAGFWVGLLNGGAYEAVEPSSSSASNLFADHSAGAVDSGPVGYAGGNAIGGFLFHRAASLSGTSAVKFSATTGLGTEIVTDIVIVPEGTVFVNKSHTFVLNYNANTGIADIHWGWVATGALNDTPVNWSHAASFLWNNTEAQPAPGLATCPTFGVKTVSGAGGSGVIGFDWNYFAHQLSRKG